MIAHIILHHLIAHAGCQQSSVIDHILTQCWNSPTLPVRLTTLSFQTTCGVSSKQSIWNIVYNLYCKNQWS